jgi:hypothetical protein
MTAAGTAAKTAAKLFQTKIRVIYVHLILSKERALITDTHSLFRQTFGIYEHRSCIYVVREGNTITAEKASKKKNG